MNRHVALLIIIASSALLLFYRLGDLALDPDEGAIILWATDLHQHGSSVFHLMKRFVLDGGFYGGYPGLNIYLSALSFRMFGLSPWAARLPSALIALCTVPFFYCVANRMLQHTTAALLSTLTFATSAPLVFLMRQCRYTSLTIFATLWLIWAYLDICDRKKYGLLQCVGAMMLFFYTSYYIFIPVAVGLALHCLLCSRREPRRTVLLFIIGMVLMLSLTRLGWSYLHSVAVNTVWHRPPITILDNVRLCLNELNLIGLPYGLVIVFFILTRSVRSTTWLPWVAGLLWGSFTVASSSLASPLLGSVGTWLDRAWPTLSPWVFNRLVDPRSYMVVSFAVVASLILRELRRPHPGVVQRLSVPIAMIIGTIIAYCIVYPWVWTRHLASTIALSFIIVGVLITEIMARNRLLALALLLLVISTNVFSVVPFVSGHYPYWQWKLPHWVYRLAVGDPCTEIILTFWIIPPL